MRAMGWNFRGFGQSGRKNLLKDYLRKFRIDIIFLQETIRQSFSLSELEGLVHGDRFFLD